MRSVIVAVVVGIILAYVVNYFKERTYLEFAV